jgi:hypothetical protein
MLAPHPWTSIPPSSMPISRIVRDPKEEFFECKYFLFLFDMNEISARLIASEVP